MSVQFPLMPRRYVDGVLIALKSPLVDVGSRPQAPWCNLNTFFFKEIFDILFPLLIYLIILNHHPFIFILIFLNPYPFQFYNSLISQFK